MREGGNRGERELMWSDGEQEREMKTDEERKVRSETKTDEDDERVNHLFLVLFRASFQGRVWTGLTRLLLCAQTVYPGGTSSTCVCLCVCSHFSEDEEDCDDFRSGFSCV